MSIGTVKYFNDLTGWGIIASDDVCDDVYVHHTAINMDGFKTLREGQRVMFELAQAGAGFRADNVSLEQ
ncbi:MAG: cold shock domain-containing protein [candidate division Zixibacteria bacterium]|nr:cold shock domain-containing protein [candidate division Zixibacteria bacterium]